jgi:hypothetical protein
LRYFTPFRRETWPRANDDPGTSPPERRKHTHVKIAAARWRLCERSLEGPA